MQNSFIRKSSSTTPPNRHCPGHPNVAVETKSTFYQQIVQYRYGIAVLVAVYTLIVGWTARMYVLRVESTKLREEIQAWCDSISAANKALRDSYTASITELKAANIEAGKKLLEKELKIKKQDVELRNCLQSQRTRNTKE